MSIQIKKKDGTLPLTKLDQNQNTVKVIFDLTKFTLINNKLKNIQSLNQPNQGNKKNPWLVDLPEKVSIIYLILIDLIK